MKSRDEPPMNRTCSHCHSSCPSLPRAQSPAPSAPGRKIPGPTLTRRRSSSKTPRLTLGMDAAPSTQDTKDSRVGLAPARRNSIRRLCSRPSSVSFARDLGSRSLRPSPRSRFDTKAHCGPAIRSGTASARDWLRLRSISSRPWCRGWAADLPSAHGGSRDRIAAIWSRISPAASPNLGRAGREGESLVSLVLGSPRIRVRRSLRA